MWDLGCYNHPGGSCEEEPQNDCGTLFDAYSILVLRSLSNSLERSFCQQTHFSRIRFYRNFDVPLGVCLRDILNNQRHPCDSCDGSPEAHIHYYAHHNKQLTIQVKLLSGNKLLDGEAQGKIWMWSHCDNCNGKENSAKKVLLSARSCCISLGKFLELSLSNRLSFTRSPSCEHQRRGDFFYFFGIGSMIATLKYSPLRTYSVYLPPKTLTFPDSERGGRLREDFEKIHKVLYEKGTKLFSEIKTILMQIESHLLGPKQKSEGTRKGFSAIEETLKQERLQFEHDLQNILKNWNSGAAVYKLVSLNQVQWELLLVSIVWDRRLHSINSSKSTSLPQENESSTLLISNQLDSEGWIWNPFPEIRNMHLEDLQKGNLLKYEPICSDAQGSSVHDIITDEVLTLRIPLGIDNYIVSDYEDELSSIIACALAFLRDPDPSNSAGDLNDGTRRARGKEDKAYERSQIVNQPSSSTSNWSSYGPLSSVAGLFSSSSLSSYFLSLRSINPMYMFDSLVSPKNPHPEVSMGFRKVPRKGKYSVCSLYVSEFQDLRRRCCSSELEYIASLSHCKSWNAQGGKSKSVFAKTLDDLYIIKEIQDTEYESFRKFAQAYFKYMKNCFELHNQTCLAKILGIHQVTVRQKYWKARKQYVMVMENLTFGRKITRQYDLKGALNSKRSSSLDGAGVVFLDQNFVEDMTESPFYVSTKAKKNLQRAVWNDTNFLSSINVMDYSLLLGIDSEKQELVCGIIDYLRKYTLDKKCESWVKSPFVVPKGEKPTVISPVDYKKRFRDFIGTRILSIPDHWCPQVSTTPSASGSSCHPESQGQRTESSEDAASDV